MSVLEPLGDDAELARRYAHPEADGRAYVRSSMIGSLDGAATVPDADGGARSGGLGGDGDRRVFTCLRAAADVVLVGAGTVRAENYGTPDHPVLAIITGGGLAPTPRLFPAGGPRPLVYVPDGVVAPELVAAGAVVVAAGGPGASGSGGVDPARVLADLYERGLRRVLAEGGPGLLGQLVAASLLDEYCLTIAPRVVGGTGKRPTAGPAAPTDRWDRLHLLTDDDGYLYGRWRVRR